MWGARQHPHGAKGKMRAKEQRRRREQWRPRAKAARCTRFRRYRGRLFYASFCLSACHCFRNHCRRNGSCHKSTYTKLLRMVDPCVCMCLVCFGRRFRKHCPGGYNPALVKDIWLVVIGPSPTTASRWACYDSVFGSRKLAEAWFWAMLRVAQNPSILPPFFYLKTWIGEVRCCSYGILAGQALSLLLWSWIGWTWYVQCHIFRRRCYLKN